MSDEPAALRRTALPPRSRAPVSGVPDLVAHQARDVFALWQAWEEDNGGRRLPPPFWAAVVAGLRGSRPRRARRRWCRSTAGACSRSAAAAPWRRSPRPVRGVRRRGQRHRPRSRCTIASRNAAANGVACSRPRSVDYSEARTALDADVVLIADLFYERGVSERLLDGLRRPAPAWRPASSSRTGAGRSRRAPTSFSCARSRSTSTAISRACLRARCASCAWPGGGPRSRGRQALYSDDPPEAARTSPRREGVAEPVATDHPGEYHARDLRRPVGVSAIRARKDTPWVPRTRSQC